MSVYLNALVVILILASITFGLFRAPLVATGIANIDFKRRRNSWFSVTLALFLSPNFWVFMLIAGLIIWRTSLTEKNPIALYFALLFAAPTFGVDITGLGMVNNFFNLNYLRLLALVLLLPAWWRLRADPASLSFGSTLPDKLLLGYLVLRFGLQLRADSFTNSLRGAFYMFMDVYLPYYVASRSLRRIEQFREAIACFVLAALVMAPLAVFEFARHWLLYSSLDRILGVTVQSFTDYLARGEALRAVVTAGQPIPLGYVMAIALCLFFSLSSYVPRPWRLVILLVLSAGIIAPLSRGPWLGAATAAVLITLVSQDARRHLFRNMVLGMLAVGAIFASPYGNKLIDYLPFFGSIGEGGVSYRQQLFQNSIQVIHLNPFFGTSDFISNPLMEDLRQGQGIVDLVNTYLAVALSSGLVGLSLFGGFFLAIFARVSAHALSAGGSEAVIRRLSVTLAGTQAAILVTIFTVSSISVIPAVYWSIFGISMAHLAYLCPAVAPQQDKRLGSTDESRRGS